MRLGLQLRVKTPPNQAPRCHHLIWDDFHNWSSRAWPGFATGSVDALLRDRPKTSWVSRLNLLNTTYWCFSNSVAAELIRVASSCSTVLTITICWSASFHFFCSIASRTPGIVFTSYPV